MSCAARLVQMDFLEEQNGLKLERGDQDENEASI